MIWQWLRMRLENRLNGKFYRCPPDGCTDSFPLHQLDPYTPPDPRGRPLQAAERNVVFRIEDTVNLGAARLEQRRHLVLGDILFLHGLGELPRDPTSRSSNRAPCTAPLMRIPPTHRLPTSITRSQSC